MLTSRLIPIAAMALFSLAAAAQEAAVPAAATSPEPTAAAPAMLHDCAAQPMRHDHGAEKGTPSPMMAGCPMASPSASAEPAGAKPKAKPIHDHAKVHKLM